MISVKEIESVVKEHADKQVNYALENAIKEQQEKYEQRKEKAKDYYRNEER